MSLKFIGTKVEFPAQIGEFRAEVTARAAVCGNNCLPDDRREAAVSGMLTYLQAVKDGRNVRSLDHLQEILQEGPKGLRIMAKNPLDRRPPICWDPTQITFKKL